MEVKLYSISLSHPARAAGLMLRYKEIEHEIVDIPPGAQRVMVRAAGFRGGTVPALKLDGCKVQGSLMISRVLDALKPEPPLFPTDPEQRAAVEKAERWGHDVLQPPPRNIFRWCAMNDQHLRQRLLEMAGTPGGALAAGALKPVAWYYARLVSGANEEAIRANLAALPAHLDHVDELIADGVIGGEQPNAADFQIGTSVRVLNNFPQLMPLIESRPAGALAKWIAPRFGRPMPIELPAEWLPEPAGAWLSS
jgi:glutathione S-transferase